MKTLTFKSGGVHPPEQKDTPADAIVRVDLPMEVSVPLKQHIGAEARPIVAKGDRVSRGEKIAEAVGVVSAPVHSPITGEVVAVRGVMQAQGRLCDAIVIKATPEDHQADMLEISMSGYPRDYSRMTPQQITAIIANKGVVGLGGATFPTAVKLSPKEAPDLLLVNGCECEPRLTCDDALMRAHASDIVQGVIIMMQACGAQAAVVGIEDNKPQAIGAMADAVKADERISVQPLKTRYPQGGEKQLIYAITGREVPSGGLPIDVGCIVDNVGTAYAVYRAVALGEPLIERVVTIEGVGNMLVPIGMNISDIIESYAPRNGGRLPHRALAECDVVAGGPMMGHSMATLDAPIVKGMSGVTFYEPLPFDPQPCVRCGFCVEACPMGLEPYYLASCGRLGLIDDAKDGGAMDCIECGSCSYSCPSARPIVDFIRMSKQYIRKRR